MAERPNGDGDRLIRSFEEYLEHFFPEEVRQRRLRSQDPDVVADQISRDAVERTRARLARST